MSKGHSSGKSYSSSALPSGVGDRFSLLLSVSLTLCINTVFSFCNRTFKPSRCLTRCLPLLFFPLIIPVVMLSSNPSLLMTCPKNLACLSLILTHNFLPVRALLSTSSLVILSMYDNLCIFLRNHISAGLMTFTAALLMVHDSLPYVRTGTMWHSNTLLRVFIEMCLFLKMVLSFRNAFLARAVLILISLIDLPSL